jgi:protein subunit release factor A
MNTRVEIHPGEGGDDAALFARELASAVARHAGVRVTPEGRVMTLVIPSGL